MKKLYFLRYCIFVFIWGTKGIKCIGQSTSPGDHFRSATSGLWGVPNTWESSTDGTNNWIPSESSPTSAANTITIRRGHSVTISNSTVADQVVVAGGAILEVATGSSSVLTVNNGIGADIIVQNGGMFKQTGISLPRFDPISTLQIESGGILEAANNIVNASDYANTASIAVASHVLWADGAIFNWNNSVSPPSEVTYFTASPVIPIFRFSKTATIGGTNPTVINGLLEADGDVFFSSAGTKTFRNGITGTGKVGVTAANGGEFSISGSTAILGGSGVLELNNNGLSINSDAALTLTSDKTINNFNNANGSITNAGTLVLEKFVIKGTSKIKIEGIVKTANINGLTGGPNTSFAAGFTVNTLGASSTIEYNGQENQVVTPLSYHNLIISGGGIKTAGAGSDIFVSGALNIIQSNTFALNGTDNLKLNKGGILNVNANATFDNGGESEVSGGGTPTINIYGTFITRDVQGFSGTGTSIPGATSTSPTIKLNIYAGSTVEYGKAGNQEVSPRDDYKNITFSGSGVKTIPKCIPKGTVIIKDNVIADASNKTFGDTSTNLTMTSGRFIVGGIGTKPDIAGTYNLTGGIIEFTNSVATKQTIRSPFTYYNIEVSGSNVGNSKGITHLANGGSFTVKSGGVFENSGYRIDGLTGNQTFIMHAGSTFKIGVKGGLSGNEHSALRNIENFIIDPKSIIEYNDGNQTITPLAAHPGLLLKGGGIKTVSGGTLVISPAADSVVIDTLVVFKVNPGAKVDFQNRPVIVHSDAAGSGMIGEIADGSSALLNTSDVTVERFIPARRAARFIASPVTTTTGRKKTINDNWMEGAVNGGISSINNPKPGYGTNITGRNPGANGFDPTITNNPSIYTFNKENQRWDTVRSTFLSLNAGDAYRLVVRGDRSIIMTTNTPAPTNTILRTTGTLKAGPHSPALSRKHNHYTFIGNPYASPVDFEKMIAYDPVLKKVTGAANNIKPEYTVFDPNLNERGAYVTYNAVQHTNSFFGSEVDKNIQPGQGFFVQTVGDNSSPAMEFRENYKSPGQTKVFRDPAQIPQFSVQLLLNLNEGLENMADGVMAFFDDNFSTAIGNEDSYKFANQDENLAINYRGISLSIEGRPAITANDTIPLKIWQYRQKSYYLRLTARHFLPEVTAFVRDTYLQKETPVDLSSATTLQFDITADSASFAKDRFSIVFKPGSALPVTLSKVKAYQKDKGIQVEWTAQSEINIERYEVEKSYNGQQFDKASAMLAKGNNAILQNYGWFDENASPGNNFYRIKVIEKSGPVKYSEVVKVNITEAKTGLTVFPNPVRENFIKVQFGNMEKGRYSAMLYNNVGQLLYSNTIEHTGRSATYTISSGRLISKGTYALRITKGDTAINKRVVVD